MKTKFYLQYVIKVKRYIEIDVDKVGKAIYNDLKNVSSSDLNEVIGDKLNKYLEQNFPVLENATYYGSTLLNEIIKYVKYERFREQ